MSDSVEPSIVRVAMAKRLASRWLRENARPEYRLTIYASSARFRNLPGLLRAFRDNHTRIAMIDPIQDLGVESNTERVTVWSTNREGMIKLDQWLTQAGCETTGIW